MKLTLTTFLTFFAVTVFAQRIKYLDADFLPVSNKSEAIYYTETTLETSISGTVKTFLLNGTLYSEAAYSDLYHKKQEGLTRTFYSNGNIKAEFQFKDGLMDGPIKTFYPNQRLKRAELYVKGKAQQSRCFSKAGYDTTYYAIQTEAQFPGGILALNKFIQANIKKARFVKLVDPQYEVIEQPTYDILVYFTITPEGKIINPKIIATRALHYENDALKLIEKMPTWIPATLDGEAIRGNFYLPMAYSR